MSLIKYYADFSARPPIESADIRERIEKIAFDGFHFNLDNVCVGEFFLSDESELKFLNLPDWAVVRREV